MAILTAVGRNSKTAIPGATIWDYGDPHAPQLFGATNSNGQYVSDGPLPSKMRVIAKGHIPIDRVSGSVTKVNLLFTELHPGAYTGYLPSSGMATWQREGMADVMQFTSTGLFRRADAIVSLESVEYIQYKMIESLNWASLGTRTNAYPTTFINGWTYLIDFYSFRFPQPGVMLAKPQRAPQTEAKFLRVN